MTWNNNECKYIDSVSWEVFKKVLHDYGNLSKGKTGRKWEANTGSDQNNFQMTTQRKRGNVSMDRGKQKSDSCLWALAIDRRWRTAGCGRLRLTDCGLRTPYPTLQYPTLPHRPHRGYLCQSFLEIHFSRAQNRNRVLTMVFWLPWTFLLKKSHTFALVKCSDL